MTWWHVAIAVAVGIYGPPAVAVVAETIQAVCLIAYDHLSDWKCRRERARWPREP